MSLTSILDSKKARKMFKEAVPNPGLANKDMKIKIPRKTNRPQVMGAAFDYLLRFALKRNYQSAKDQPWVAWEALLEILPALPPKEFAYFLGEYKWAQNQYKKYLKGGRFTKNLARACLFLGYLDAARRTHWIPEQPFQAGSEEIEELLCLVRRTDMTLFSPGKYLSLNPTFGRGSNLVGGADADLVVDDMIVDIKTYSKRVLDRTILNQLLGYYLLSRIGAVKGLPSRKKINRIAVYWSRHAKLDVWNLYDLATEQEYKRLEMNFRILVHNTADW